MKEMLKWLWISIYILLGLKFLTDYNEANLFFLNNTVQLPL